MSAVISIGLLLLIVNVGVLSKYYISDREQLHRANYVQNILKDNLKNEGRIKLFGGPSKYEGNVYVYHAGRWGAVCDDSWDNAAAQVVCRQLNRTGKATRGSQYGEAKKKFWMDDVVCQGNEPVLHKCEFSGWGVSDCEVSEAAGVICTEELSNNIPQSDIGRKIPKIVQSLPLNNEIKSTMKLRLLTNNKNNRNVRSNKEGRVEIFYDHSWGSICPEGWSLYEAMVVCRNLGQGFAAAALQTDHFGNSNIMLSKVRCYGNESSLFDCQFEFGDFSCHADSGHVAAVTCTDRLADLVLDTNAIEISAHLQDVPMYMLQCAMEENCLSKSAYMMKEENPNWHFETRRLLRFTASSFNMGNDEFRPYLPKNQWQWHLCHMHYHSMEVFATFDILNRQGRRIADGHKASFCLEDNTCLPGVEKKYSCKNYGDQGISVNCSDVYLYNIDCQWVDVTDVEPGDYTFKVAVNPHAKIPEQYFENNAAVCQLRIADTYARVYGCVLTRP